MIHGFAGSIADLTDLGRWLNRDGYVVSGIRLAGHGTNVHDLHHSSVDDWMASIRTGLDRTDHRLPVFTIGESMGALLALRLARENKRIQGIVALAPPFVVRHGRRNAVFSPLLPPALRMRKQWVKPAMVASHRQRGSLLEVTVGAYRRLQQLIREERAALSHTHVPVLAMFATHDYLTDPRSANFIRRTLPPHRLQTIMFPDSVHHLIQISDKQRLYQPIQAFIGKNVNAGLFSTND